MAWVRIQLTEEQQQIVDEERFAHSNLRIREQMLVLWLSHKGSHAKRWRRTMCELLRKIAALGLTGPITLVLDNARYQHNAAVKTLAKELGITLLFLPSYSPNLNLIERLWKFIN
jgi:hypothetical protein